MITAAKSIELFFPLLIRGDSSVGYGVTRTSLREITIRRMDSGQGFPPSITEAGVSLSLN